MRISDWSSEGCSSDLHTEDQIGFKLFALSSGRLVATDEAHALFREVRESFEQLRSLEQVVKNIKANGGGHLRLGVVPSLGLSTAPRAISRFRELHPDVTFDVRTLQIGSASCRASVCKYV